MREFRLWRWWITLQWPITFERLISPDINVHVELTPLLDEDGNPIGPLVMMSKEDVERWFGKSS